MPPSNNVIEQLHTALLSAFSKDEFERLIYIALDKSIDEIIFARNQEEAVFAVLEWAAKRGKLSTLIKSACKRNPNNPQLKSFIEHYGNDPTQWPGGFFRPDLRTIYLDQLIVKSDRFLLSQLTPNSLSRSKLSLSEYYIPLLVVRQEKVNASEFNTKNNEPDGDLATADAELIGEYESLLEQANHYQHLLILGESGSGKSIFLKFVALCMAGDLLANEELNLSNLIDRNRTNREKPNREDSSALKADETQKNWSHGGLLPIYISLQDFAAGGFIDLSSKPSAALFMKYFEAELNSAELGEYIEDLRAELRERGGILLLDGLDEIPDTDRERQWVGEAIVSFILSYPNVRTIITSRSYDTRQSFDPLVDFHQVRIAPFVPQQIQDYIVCAYPLLRNLHKFEDDQPETVNEALHSLRYFINRNASLRELVRTPLMLALLVATFARHTGASLGYREEIYEQIMNLLLWKWEEPERSRISRDGESDRRNQKELLSQEPFDKYQELIRSVLEEIAYENYLSQDSSESISLIDGDKILGVLTRKIKSDLAIQITDYLLDRSGIFKRQHSRRYYFLHRTLHEYLTACYLHKRNNFVREMLQLMKSDPQKWREVFLFAAAKEARHNAVSAFALINRLCPMTFGQNHHDDTDGKSALQIMLSGRALIETGLAATESLDEFDQTIIERVRLMLTRVLESDYLHIDARLIAGLDLGILGDLRSGIGINEQGLPKFEMQEVQTGEFWFGVDTAKSKEPSAGKIHYLIQKPYEISRYPITVLQFTAFVEVGGYHQKQFWTDDGWAWRQEKQIESPEAYTDFLTIANQPQVGVSWYEVSAFCNWLSAKTGDDFSLPSEPEWERAARGTDGRTFPWGSNFTISDCNMLWTGVGHPSPVGVFSKNKSPCGAEDMVGNVWEWCATLWQSSYKNYSESLLDHNVGKIRYVLRGGSWANQRIQVRCANRHRNFPDHRGPNVGFRVVRR